MNSALYFGWVRHRRFSPRAHDFRYPIGLLYLDLAEQQRLFDLSPLTGRGRLAPFAFRETDFLPGFTRRGIPLADAVRQRVGEALGQAPQGPIRLLAQPRSWGLAFNPASFFYCFDTSERLVAILCEVTNTPWRQRYHYVMPVSGDGHQHHRVDKAFHVSPFLPRELEYRMSFSPVGQDLGIHMEDWRGDDKLFDATLRLTRAPLDRASLHRYLWRFPWTTARTLAAIHWQALRLLLKRTPLFDHQDADDEFRLATLSSQEHDDEKHQPQRQARRPS
ncbi:DUF1365 domain-containing protein [Metapseudomonas furukawaii]|uniref:DUF1365 domain-containing protein n=1 Tax=Metapseudomonas furukawaii TaxID=1149133 RepID=A0AAD1FHQ4_METFU|nr:DUF1365 domain-containing protein [Pseudomonas furukawaii]ELS29295.1 Hypothetical protein ppKF707_0120 [Pseudomonas furukawaii]BAU76482.1 hypothetical protein KF707C_47940 [Pseudomonas furukawaii]